MNEEVSTTAPPSPVVRWRAWHPLVGARDRFGWLLGLQVALAFAGPAVVAHLGGLGVADAAVMSLAGLLFVLLASALPPGRARLTGSPTLVVAIGAAGVVAAAVSLRSPVGVVVLVAAAAASAMAPSRSAGLAAPARAFALSLVLLTAVAPSGHVTLLLVEGALIALVASEIARVLAHPRLPMPPLPGPPPASPVPQRHPRTHALRLAIAIGICAGVAVFAGTGSPFAAHASWAMIGVWVALRPHHHLTRDLALQRCVGTVLGAAATIALVAAYPSSQWLGWLLIPLVFVAFGLRSVNYAWYCVAVTPVIVVGFTGTHVDLEVLAARVAWTALGVVIAYAVARLVRPEPAIEVAPAVSSVGSGPVVS